jgi:hypothetical protein
MYCRTFSEFTVIVYGTNSANGFYPVKFLLEGQVLIIVSKCWLYIGHTITVGNIFTGFAGPGEGSCEESG